MSGFIYERINNDENLQLSILLVTSPHGALLRDQSWIKNVLCPVFVLKTIDTYLKIPISTAVHNYSSHLEIGKVKGLISEKNGKKLQP